MIGFASFLVIVELTSTGPKFNSMMLIATGMGLIVELKFCYALAAPRNHLDALSDVTS